MKFNQRYLVLKSLPLELWWQLQLNWQQSFFSLKMWYELAWCTGAKYHWTMRLKVGVLRVCDFNICSGDVGWFYFSLFSWFCLPNALHKIFIRIGWDWFSEIFLLSYFALFYAMYRLLLLSLEQLLLPFIVLTIFFIFCCCVWCEELRAYRYL